MSGARLSIFREVERAPPSKSTRILSTSQVREGEVIRKPETDGGVHVPTFSNVGRVAPGPRSRGQRYHKWVPHPSFTHFAKGWEARKPCMANGGRKVVI